MRSFIAKCAILGLLVAGFAFTGDAGRFLARGKGVLEATTVPRADADAQPQPPFTAPATAPASHPAAAEQALPPATPRGEASPSGTHAEASPSGTRAEASPSGTRAEASPSGTRAPSPPADAPVAGGPTGKLPLEGPSSVVLADLAAGDRVVVWVRRRGDRAAFDTLAYEMIDPAGGDAIEVRGAAHDAGQASHAPRRRVRITGSVPESRFRTASSAVADGRVVCRRALAIAPIGTSGRDTAAPAETIGPVVAIEVVRAH